jgi:hypothetical protein
MLVRRFIGYSTAPQPGRFYGKDQRIALYPANYLHMVRWRAVHSLELPRSSLAVIACPFRSSSMLGSLVMPRPFPGGDFHSFAYGLNMDDGASQSARCFHPRPG